MNKKYTNALLILSAVTLLSGCGTISGLTSLPDQAPLEPKNFDVVSVLDFDNTTESKKAGITFADKIAQAIENKDLFKTVVRGPSEEKALIIHGTITKFENGSASARFWVGLGAGSAYFDANIYFKDSLENQDLAIIKVDKNSWVMGGALAASQTPETFMDEAAKVIADELSKSMK